MLPLDTKYALDRMNSTSIKHGLGTRIHHTVNVQKCIYDFTVSGGLVSTINLLDDDGAAVVIPSGAIIQRVLINVPVAVTSGGSATVALGAVTTTDLLGATAKTSFSLNAMLDGVPVDTAATSLVPLLADKTPTLTIAVAALTAGKIYVFIRYVRTV